MPSVPRCSPTSCWETKNIFAPRPTDSAWCRTRAYATGGWGPDEAFVVPGKVGLDASLGTTHASFETPCGAYGHFKITRYLLRVTKDSRYGDSMERMLYNTIAGATPILADGTSFYYSDYNNSAKKGSPSRQVAVLLGNFPATDGRLRNQLVLPEPGRNLCKPVPALTSLLVAEQHAMSRLTQNTQYPNAKPDPARIHFGASGNFHGLCAHSAWIGPGTRVSVNGHKAESEVARENSWHCSAPGKIGDRVEVEFEMPMRAGSHRRSESQQRRSDAWPARAVRGRTKFLAPYP